MPKEILKKLSENALCKYSQEQRHSDPSLVIFIVKELIRRPITSNIKHELASWIHSCFKTNLILCHKIISHPKHPQLPSKYAYSIVDRLRIKPSSLFPLDSDVKWYLLHIFLLLDIIPQSIYEQVVIYFNSTAHPLAPKILTIFIKRDWVNDPRSILMLLLQDTNRWIECLDYLLEKCPFLKDMVPIEIINDLKFEDCTSACHVISLVVSHSTSNFDYDMSPLRTCIDSLFSLQGISVDIPDFIDSQKPEIVDSNNQQLKFQRARPSLVLSILVALTNLSAKGHHVNLSCVFLIINFITDPRYQIYKEKLNKILKKAYKLMGRLIQNEDALEQLHELPEPHWKAFSKALKIEMDYMLISDLLNTQKLRTTLTDVGILEHFERLPDSDSLSGWVLCIERACIDSSIRYRLKNAVIPLLTNVIQEQIHGDLEEDLFNREIVFLNKNYGLDKENNDLQCLFPIILDFLISSSRQKLDLDFSEHKSISLETYLTCCHLLDSIQRYEAAQLILLESHDIEKMVSFIADVDDPRVFEIIMRIIIRIATTFPVQKNVQILGYSKLFEPLITCTVGTLKERAIKQISSALVYKLKEIIPIILAIFKYHTDSYEDRVKSSIAFCLCLGPFVLYRLMNGLIDMSHFQNYPTYLETLQIVDLLLDYLYIQKYHEFDTRIEHVLEYLARYVPFAMKKFKEQWRPSCSKIEQVLNMDFITQADEILLEFPLENHSITVSRSFFESSPVYQKMISPDFSEGKENRIQLHEDSNLWKFSILFYTNLESLEIKNPTQDQIKFVFELLEFSEKYLWQQLMNETTDWICKVCDIIAYNQDFELAVFTYQQVKMLGIFSSQEKNKLLKHGTRALLLCLNMRQ